MTTVAMATAAAPTFFQPFSHGGYIFLDGGLWANNPIMVALVDSLSCFSIGRGQVRILSIGCGHRPYIVDKKKLVGGIWAWRKIVESAMHLQSSNAIGQAGLLIGRNRITRVDPGAIGQEIELDDWSKAIDILPEAAEKAAAVLGSGVSDAVLAQRVERYRPFAVENDLRV